MEVLLVNALVLGVFGLRVVKAGRVGNAARMSKAREYRSKDLAKPILLPLAGKSFGFGS
ncbi:MAG: hypothetical protein GXY42_04320 [Desulfovibrionales bacterium]|nr:hypothetical protein [Desulfovibrionales bacterium]